MGSFKKNREVLLALCLCSALVNNVYAAETSKSQNDLEKYVLDEYVVTATKTALSEKKVPPNGNRSHHPGKNQKSWRLQCP